MSTMLAARSGVWLIAPTVFVALLAFPGTVALRTIVLAITTATAAWAWRQAGYPRLPMALPLAIWGVISAVSVLNSIQLRYSLGEFRVEYVYGLLAFWGFYVLAHARSALELWGRTLALTLAPWLVITLTGATLAAVPHAGEPFGDVGIVSTYLVLLFPVVTLIVLRDQTPKHLALAAAMSIAIVITGYHTRNRMMWICLGATTVVGLALLWGRTAPSGRLRLLKWAGVFVLVVAVVFGVTLKSRADQVGGIASVSKSLRHDARFEIWSYALERIEQKPMRGHGFGRSILATDFRARFGFDHGHNVFLDQAVQSGIPGAIALMLVFAALLVKFLKLSQHSVAPVRHLGVAGVMLVVGLVLKCQTDDFFVRESALLFWSMAGALLGAANREAGARPG